MDRHARSGQSGQGCASCGSVSQGFVTEYMSLQNPSFWPGAKLLDLPRKRSPGDTELIPYVMYIIQLGILKLWEGLGSPAATGARSTFRARLVLPSLACSPAGGRGRGLSGLTEAASTLPVLRGPSVRPRPPCAVCRRFYAEGRINRRRRRKEEQSQL